MIRGNTKYLLCAAALVALTACDGCYEAQDERRLVLTFNKPSVGAQLSDADDADGTRNGLQYDVEIKLEWESLTDGSRAPADIAEAGLSVAKQGEDFPDAVAGTIAPGGIATFLGVTFATNGDYNLRATARELGSQQTTDPNTILISVQSVPDRPKVLTSKIVQDTNDDLKVSLAELPVGEAMKVAFTAANMPNGGTAKVLYQGAEVGSGTVSNGAGEVALTGLPYTTATENTQYALVIHLEDPARIPNAPTANPPDTLTVTLDQTPPTVTITEPTDRDGGYGTRTLTATAVVTGAPGATVHFEAVHPDAGSMDAGSAVVDLGGTATTTVSVFNGRQDLWATVADSVGNAADASVNFLVDSQQCNVTITSPANGAYLGPSQDAVPGGATFEFDVVGRAPECAGGSALISIGTVTFNGAVDVNGNFSVRVQLQQGENTVRADAFNPAGVAGVPQVATVTVASTDFAITYPANNVVLNISNDLDAVTPLIQSSFNYTPAALPTGTRVDVCINVAPATNPQPCPDGSAGFYLLASAVPTPAAGFTYLDGTQYFMKALLVESVTGLVKATTPNITLTVDSVRPLVTAVAFATDANADGKINATEFGTGLSANVTLNGVEVGRTVRAFNDTTGAACGTATVTSTTSPTTIALTCLTAPLEATVTLRFEVTDAAGNANKVSTSTPGSDPVNTTAFKTVIIDTVAPTFTFARPSKSALGAADDESTTSGFQLTVGGAGSADLGSVSFTIASGSSTQTQVATPSGSSAEYQFTLTGGGDRTYDVTAVPTDASGNSGTAVTRQVRVDLDAPVVTVTQPTAANNPYGSFQLQVSVSVPGESGTVSIYSRVGGTDTLLGQLTLTNGVATGNITFPNGTQDVVAKYSDAAGNAGEGVSPGIIVNATGCSITLTTPAPTGSFLGRSAGTYVAASNTLTYVITGTTSCPNRAVSFFEGTGTTRTSIAATVNTDGSGNFSQTVSYSEAAHHLEVDINNGAGVITTASRDFTVDLTLPSVSAVTPANTTLNLVAPTNIFYRNSAAGYFVDGDTSATAPGAQLTLNYTANGAPNGTTAGKVSILYGSSVISGPFNVSAASAPSSTVVTLPQATSGQLEIRVVDPAGNSASYFANAVVDVVAPTAPSFAPTPVERHAATVSLTWPTAFDDNGDSSSGSAQNFDVRWSTTVILPSGIQTEAEFFDTTKTVQHTGALIGGSTTLPLTLTLPPMNTHALLVRAVDDVGNYSAFVPSTQVNNVWPTAQFANPNPAANSGYASHLATGDLNGDGVADLVTTTWGISPGAAHIMYGSDAGVGSITRQQITPTETGTSSFGSDFDIGQVGDQGSEGIDDLLLSAPTSVSNAGRAYLYFGATGGLSNSAGNYVVFIGNAAAQLGRGAQIVNDINADGLGEILLSAHTEDSGRGRVYLFFGRSKSAWNTLATNNGGSIPMSAADRQFLGPNPISGSTNHFGRNRGYASLGDVNGDNVPDFTVPDSLDTVNKLFVFSGQTVVSRTATTGIPTLTTGTGTTADDSLKVLSAGISGTGITREGFSSRAAGVTNLFSTGTRDLLVSQPFDSKVWLLQGSSTATFPNAPVAISGRANSNFGFGIATGDLNGDGRPDIVAGESASNGAVWFFFNRPTSGFDSAAGSGFFQGRVNSSTLLGTSVAVGDFNADGKLDIAAGDPNEAVGGTVTLWY